MTGMSAPSKLEIDVSLNCELKKILGEDFCGFALILEKKVYVWIEWVSDNSVYEKIYDISVLEPGVKAATEFIHLDWLFS
jgi:hypothetical protein